MDVRCPKCQTLYELDDTQVKSPIITLKCSQCQYVFRHESRHATVQENHRRWMVRKRKTGDILYCNAFDVLHQWIMSGQVSKRDSISRTGTKWMELGEIGEFQPVFQVVESISTLTGQPLPEDSSIAVRKVSDSHAAQAPEPAPAPPARMPTPAQGVPSGAPGPRNRERIRTELQFAPLNPPEEVTQRARPSRMTPGALPAPLPPNPRQLREERQPTPAPTALGGTVETPWQIGDDVPHTHLTSEVTSQTALPPRSKAPWIVVGLLVCGGLAYAGFTQGAFDGLMAPEAPTEVVALGNSTGAQVPATDGAPPQTAAQTAPPQTAKQNASPELAEAIATSSPKVHHALGVAAQAGEVAAQTSSPDEKVEEARRVLERGRASQALGMFKEVLDVAPKHAGAVAGLGWCYIEMGRFDDAAANFRRAIDLDPRQGDALIGLGTAERQRGNLKSAYDAYDLYLGRFPKGSKTSIARYQLDALRQQLGL